MKFLAIMFSENFKKSDRYIFQCQIGEKLVDFAIPKSDALKIIELMDLKEHKSAENAPFPFIVYK